MGARPLSSDPPRPEVVERLIGEAVASRIADRDPTVWPTAARPGWVAAARAARPLVGEIEGLRERHRVAGRVRVVVAAAGGVGIAAEALAGVDPQLGASRLIVLDTTDPAQVADAVAGDLAATVLVVSAPAGEDTAAVELVRDTVHDALRADGLDPAEHTVVVTAPDGPLLRSAGRATVVLGPPDVDGPWAALTAYALVPAGLAGTDVAAVLADAIPAADDLASDDPDNPALRLGALLAQAQVVALAGDDAPGMAEWAAQLVAAGLGKHGRGPLPVVVEGPDAPEWTAAGVLAAGLGAVPGAAVAGTGSPAAQMVLWQHATAVAAHLLGVDPTDRPDAGGTGTDIDTGTGTDDGTGERLAFRDGGIDVHAGSWLPSGTATVGDALRALLDGGACLSVHAYLDRLEDASAAVLRAELARRTGRAVAFGWAPRCLPGTGQRDKGGPADTVVCQLTGTAEPDLPPDLPPALEAYQQAQARTDAAALAQRGRPVLRLHFTDRVAGLVTLARAVQQL
ncbi:glucose-6-phosphate isomerase [Pseudonocardia nigra]|uniref:glucose-6-phosphate isomerase n=1 Tax=Pseudonocardia nigra TaxID=1921578 RepID=UPI001C5CCD54|nr:glucose-6-phosphate isomerase [Pseudonocardia nigra]